MISAFAAWVALLLFGGGMIFAGLKDMVTMTIPNHLVLLLAVAYFMLAPLAGIAPQIILTSALAATAVLVCTFVLFTLGWIGGGDAKLSAVAVLWLGANVAFEYLLYASIGGALFTLALLQYRRIPLPVLLQAMEWPRRLHTAGTGVPYGVVLALAALLLLPRAPWLPTII